MNPHKLVKKLLPGPKRTHLRMVVHALIDLGKVKKLECSYEHCLYDSREFNTGAGNANNPLGLTVDHTFGHTRGDRYTNLNVMHHGCNSSKGARFYLSTAKGKRDRLAQLSSIRRMKKRRVNLRARLKVLWADPKYRRKMIHSGNRHWSKKPGALKKYQRGKNHWTHRRNK